MAKSLRKNVKPGTFIVADCAEPVRFAKQDTVDPLARQRELTELAAEKLDQIKALLAAGKRR